MKFLSAGLTAHYASGTTTLATCWKVVLKDGTVIAATSLDKDLTFAGTLYAAKTSYNQSDIESSNELNPDNLEVEGFMEAASITDDDIHSGRLDGAYVTIFEVNYEDLTMGRNILREGTIGEVRGGRSKFTAELRGLMQTYTTNIVRITTKECIADLGDAHCKVDLEPITVTGAITGVSNNRILADTSRTEEDDWFTGAKLTFTSGANVDRSMEVKRSAVGELELHEPMFYPIEVGDEYTVYAGCLKRFEEDCIGKHDNGLNFYGFPDLPGNAIYRTGGVDYAHTPTTWLGIPVDV